MKGRWGFLAVSALLLPMTAAGPAPTVEWCHWDRDAGAWEYDVISVGASEKGHGKHSLDGPAGGPVAGMDGYIHGADCTPEMECSPLPLIGEFEGDGGELPGHGLLAWLSLEVEEVYIIIIRDDHVAGQSFDVLLHGESRSLGFYADDFSDVVVSATLLPASGVPTVCDLAAATLTESTFVELLNTTAGEDLAVWFGTPEHSLVMVVDHWDPVSATWPDDFPTRVSVYDPND